MNVKELFLEAISIAKLSLPAMGVLAQSPAKTQHAFLLIGISSFASAFGFVLFPVTVLGLSFRPDVLQVVVSVASGFFTTLFIIFLANFFAQRFFHGISNLPSYFRVVGYGSVVGILGLVPAFGLIAALWILVIHYTALKELHRLNQRNAVLVLVLVFVAVFVLGYAFSMLGLARYTASGALSPYSVNFPGA